MPLGEKENIAHNVKLELARSLQQDYPLEFFQLLARFAAQDGDDAAVPLLKKWCKKTVNRFSEELLTVVEALADMAWRRKSLTRESYRIFCDWAEKERENFAEDIIPKDVRAKTWYTLCSFDSASTPRTRPLTDRSSMRRILPQRLTAARATTAMLPQKRYAITASFGAFSRTSDRSRENLKCSARAP